MPTRSQLSQYILKSKYAKYNPELKRRETYDEAVSRVEQMMIRKYPHIEKSIKWAYKFLRDGKILGSQRTLQFGGEAIESRNFRGFNCVVQYADRLRFFQETFWLLLCGCGVGFSVQKHHIARIPKFVSGDVENVVHTIEDSIEGWADAAGVLLDGYFGSPAYVTFNYEQIRPQGSPISTGGKAPGPEPLRKALEQIRTLLDRCVVDGQEQLRSIDVFDIVMYLADSVLSGGVRRSATLCLFSPDDELMITSKTGNWYVENPQRARANISAMLVRHKTSFEQFQKFFKSTKEWGEPGFYWADNTEMTPNPCFHPDTLLATEIGLVRIKDLFDSKLAVKVSADDRVGKGDEIQYTSAATGVSLHDATPVFLTQKNAPIFEVLTSDGHRLKVTDTHEFPTFVGRKQLKELKVGSRLLLPSGEGSFGPIGLYEEGKALAQNPGDHVPDAVLGGSRQMVIGYLHGIIEQSDIRLVNKGFSPVYELSIKLIPSLLQDLQVVLAQFGFLSRYDDYETPEYLIVNDGDLVGLYRSIGFGNNPDHQSVANLIENDTSKWSTNYTTLIESITPCGNSDVYCLTQHDTNTVHANGIVTGQCVEVSFAPSLLVDEKDCVDGHYKGVPARLASTDPAYEGREVALDKYLVSGTQACNLCSIFMTTVESEQDFLERCRAAGVIGTLQAGLTDSAYLGSVSEEITRKEALLGVSLTGVMDKPQYGLSPSLLEQGVEAIAKANEEISAKIGINRAARLTALKPEGTGSLLLGTLATGRHGWPFKRGIRHVQGNRLEAPLAFLRGVNPTVVERSSWSANDTDEVLAFPIEAPEGAVLESDMTAIESLDQVKLLQKHWINPGRRPELCTQPWLNNSVSNTIKVGPDEWDDVARKIYDDNEYYTGLSLLARTGDKDYRQAPNVSVKTPAELVEEYGQRAISMAEGLLDDREIKTIFPTLWDYCDAIMGVAKSLRPSQVVAVSRARTQISDVFFYGDAKSTTYLLKDVYYARRYNQLVADWKPVPWEDLIEEDDTTNVAMEVSCASGACSI